MSSHAYHETLPGYHPDQLLVDHCSECERRAKQPDRGIASLDPARFRHAWTRANQRQAMGIADLSYAELPLLDVLAAVQAQMKEL